MPISEVYNTDCVEYMRTLPDGCFDLAICDPPYGDASGGAADRFGQRFDRYKPQITPPTHTATTASGDGSTGTRDSFHFNGSNFKRYKKGGDKNTHERRKDTAVLPLFRKPCL